MADFALGEDIRGYVAERYTEMNAFTKEGQLQQRAEVVWGFASSCDVEVENLTGIAQPLRGLLAASQMYILTANNLRAALGVEGAISLDVAAKNEAVNRRCLTDIDAYLQVAGEDPVTPHAVETRETLLALLSANQEWSASQLGSILEHSHPDSSVEDLSQAPPTTWRALAGQHRFALTVPNLTAYIEQHRVDVELARCLTVDGVVIERRSVSDQDDAEDTDDSAETQKAQLALNLLNAHKQLRAADRAGLVAQLDVGPSDLPVTELEPAPDDLFAEALDRGLLEASEDAFDRFATAGWPAVSKALSRHHSLRQFVTAPRITGLLTQGMLEDDEAPTELHDRVFRDFDNFIEPTSAEPGLYRAAARRAVKREEKLSIARIGLLADHAPDQDTIVPLLAAHQGLDGDQLIAILVKIGAPYDLLQKAGEEADLPAGSAATTLFNRLATTGRVKLVNTKTRFRVL